MLHVWSNFDRTLNELDRALRSAADDPRRGRGATAHAELTLQQDDDGWVIHANLPGASADDLTIEVKNGAILLRAKGAIAPPDGYRALRQERRPWALDRTVRLPDSVLVEQVSARLVDGRLAVRLPSRPTAEDRAIPVEAA